MPIPPPWMERKFSSPGTVFLSRLKAAGARQLDESMADLFRLKAELLPKLRQFPVVLEEKPVVCAWYPTARVVAAVESLRAARNLYPRIRRKSPPRGGRPAGC